MADARKLREKLGRAWLASAGEVHEGEELFSSSDYAMWTAPPFRKVEPASDGGNGQSHTPDIERSGGNGRSDAPDAERPGAE